jgi:hypothetical protein
VPGAPDQQWYTHIVPRTSSLSVRAVPPGEAYLAEDGVQITLTAADGTSVAQEGACVVGFVTVVIFIFSQRMLHS